MSAPVPITAIVEPPAAPAASAPSCAAASMPSASPLTIVWPARGERLGEAPRVDARPARVALRLPTIASVDAPSSSTRPLTYNSGGGSVVSSSAAG